MDIGMLGKDAPDLFRVNLAIHVGRSQDLVTRGFHRAGLMAVDVTAVGRNDGLIGAQRMGDGHHVGRRSAHHKVDIGICTAALFANPGNGAVAVHILAIAGGFDKVALDERIQHLGACAFFIVTSEADHIRLCSFCVYRNKMSLSVIVPHLREQINRESCPQGCMRPRFALK